MKRAALYVRVSTDEQAIHGYSIETQKDNLLEYCEKNGYKVIDIYADEGVSGGKATDKRPAQSRLLDDVKSGKIDIIFFTKLDRWFRNTKEYFKTQDVLESHHVDWIAIHESYDTTTANGRFAITVFLAIAQNEREKTSERIKVVFDHKRKNGEYPSPAVPFGYNASTEGGKRHLEIDPNTEPIMADFWKCLIQYNNVYKAYQSVEEKYGYTKPYYLWIRYSKNPIYCGEYHGIKDFCPAYVTREQWDSVQKQPIKRTQKNRIYLFTGLIVCPVCGKRMFSGATSNVKGGKEFMYYFCGGGKYKTCPWNHSIAERKTEKYLLDHLPQMIEKTLKIVEEEKQRAKPKTSRVPAIKEKIRRLNIIFLNGGKTDQEYAAELASLKEQLAAAEAETSTPDCNIDLLRSILQNDFKSLYDEMNRENQRRFWRSIIQTIHVNDNLTVESVDFL